MRPVENKFTISETTVLMPIGGKATRAREVTKDAIPKHLIPMGDEVIFDVVCRKLQSVGFRKFIFCVGHHSDKIRKHIKSAPWARGSIEYIFSEETSPLGVDGSVLNAITKLKLDGQGIIIPGDMMFPWHEVRRMDDYHRLNNHDITISMTNNITKRSGDIGKMIVKNTKPNLLMKVYSREATNIDVPANARALTCAAATSIDMKKYAAVCADYLLNNPQHGSTPLSMRDYVAPWAVRASGHTIHTYELRGEILDLGTPSNIYYIQRNWRQYA